MQVSMDSAASHPPGDVEVKGKRKQTFVRIRMALRVYCMYNNSTKSRVVLVVPRYHVDGSTTRPVWSISGHTCEEHA